MNLLHSSVVGIDVETLDPDLKKLGPGYFRDGSLLVGVGIANEDDAQYFGIRHNGGNVPDRVQFLKQLSDEARNFTGILVGHNLRYDLGWLYANGVEFPRAHFYCTRNIEGLIASNEQSLSLEKVAPRRGVGEKLECPVPWDKIMSVPAPALSEYCVRDAILSRKIFYAHQKHPHFARARKAVNLECKLYKCLFYLSMRGTRIDKEYLLSYMDRKELVVQQALQRLKLDKIDAPKPLFDRLGIVPDIVTPKTGKPSYAQAVVKKYADKHPEMQLLLEAKTARVELGLARGVYNHLVGDRIHPIYRHEGSRGDDDQDDEKKGSRYGRLAAAHPNLQQAPKTPDFRAMFIPEDGKVWVSADYSQQEPRLCVALAHLAGVKTAKSVVDAYNNDPNLDLYQQLATAGGIERKVAKIIFLGRVYGLGRANMIRSLGLGDRQAQDILRAFNKAAPFVDELIAKIKRHLPNDEGVLFTYSGRPYYFGTNKGDTFAYKAINRLVQGNAAEQTKAAIIRLARAGFDICATIHDENCVSCDETDKGEIARIMTDGERKIDTVVPSKVDIKSGANWGETS